MDLSGSRIDQVVLDTHFLVGCVFDVADLAQREYGDVEEGRRWYDRVSVELDGCLETPSHDGVGLVESMAYLEAVPDLFRGERSLGTGVFPVPVCDPW